MSTKLREVLAGEEANFILPFFWQHGEEEAILREEIARIYESGIKAVCVEARPHPDFLGPRWWRDMDVIMDEARVRGMKVWVFDDDHFPTGHAAGQLKEAPQELRRLFLSALHVDALGPKPNSSFQVAVPFLPGFYEAVSSQIIVIAIKRDSASGELLEERVDLSSSVIDGKLYWDVPEGYWRIFTIFENTNGGDPTKRDYLNPIVKESVRVLIDTVYEAFYARYGEDFGDTFAGFFSDEPGFYNGKNPVITNFDTSIGKMSDLPWSPEMYRLLEQEVGANYTELLPLLWHGQGESVSKIRYHYMNLVSKLYAEYFTSQIGDWCRSHGVEYIGHVIEDNNVHSRLGVGSGHFFRALGGQDMSGLDVVLWQLNPGFDEIPSAWVAGEADNEFYNYGLAKMASSLAHLDAKKQGRTMAEVFGAYGWVEGLKLMKWMTDHMLVRGVNYFVPHAFSPKEFPDPDCPPHLYARGQNPQFRYYKYLNHYTNRMSHLLSGGVHIASAAVLYHAEAEWSGEYMYFHKPVKELMQNQIDCDVVTCDLIVSEAEIQNGKMLIQNESYSCLVVPYSEALPKEVMRRILELAEAGIDVYFVGGLPKRTSEGGEAKAVERLALCNNAHVVNPGQLATVLRSAGHYEIQISNRQPYLRYFHMRHQDMDVYMFFNEHPIRAINTEAALPVQDNITFYDAYNNKLVKAAGLQEGDRTRLLLNLAPFESIVVVAASDKFEIEENFDAEINGTAIAINGTWNVATAASEQYPDFAPWGELATLTDLSLPGFLPDFAGTIRYEIPFAYTQEIGGHVIIDLGDVFETAEVFVNGNSAGVRISTPYRYNVTPFMQNGENTLTIEVTNTLSKKLTDFCSRLAQHEPSGLLGPVSLCALIEKPSKENIK
ncbi:glycosyl transferase family 2 [Paenibacillus sp. HN-1]|uniref:glycosyl hydrolase n=1 Tax=Paenibacillus TaxID=44249 RepID=UPI001CA8CAFB|nr:MULTISPECIES: glycosyl hydrolase [Paenibacillus]MBY9078348.1 glycosyl transferase family 2 [Paenibacillus sp. CGMCC 1.18879]MBY9083160.1 glycosyl transferase family 2 [Paenibacillus sinensis]